jgi:hypothetical protein
MAKYLIKHRDNFAFNLQIDFSDLAIEIAWCHTGSTQSITLNGDKIKLRIDWLRADEADLLG